ncbi:MAG: transcriptional regulator [Paracoccaceae bacterium]
MSRPRSIPDDKILGIALALVEAGGERAATFSAVAEQSGLAASSLVQRYKSRDGMVTAAVAMRWRSLLAGAQGAAAKGKGAAGLLKALDAPHPDLLTLSLRDPGLRAQAADWREAVVAALTLRLGGKAARDQAEQLFATWQGQAMWRAMGGKGFRLKAAAKGLSG